MISSRSSTNHCYASYQRNKQIQFVISRISMRTGGSTASAINNFSLATSSHRKCGGNQAATTLICAWFIIFHLLYNPWYSSQYPTIPIWIQWLKFKSHQLKLTSVENIPILNQNVNWRAVSWCIKYKILFSIMRTHEVWAAYLPPINSRLSPPCFQW